MSHAGRTHESQPPSPPVRLPRLAIMDSDHGFARARASNTPPERSQEKLSGMTSQTSWSPPRDVGLPIAPSSSRAGPSMLSPGSSRDSWRPEHRSFSASQIPRLPEPTRKSGMMAGSLPPLATLQSDGPSIGHIEHPHPGAPPRRLHRASTSHVMGDFPRPSGPSTVSEGPKALYAPLAARRTSIASVAGLPAPSMPSTMSMDSISASRKAAKAHVSSACLNCKRAHLACDSERPCRRCAKLGKTATCVDVQHKKRGRPRLKDRENEEASPLELQHSSVGPWRSATQSPSAMYYAVPPPGSGQLPLSEAGPVTYAPHHREFPEAPSQSHPGAASPGHQAPQPQVRKAGVVATLLCGLDLAVVHASQECQALLGLLPSQVCQRSIADFLHPADLAPFEGMWQQLAEPVGLRPSPFPQAGLEMMHRTTCHLLSPARGTIFLEEVLRVHIAGDAWAPCSIRIHLGGAFGLDLYRPETQDRAFVVCSLLLADHPSAAASHPNHHSLASAAFDPMGWPGTVFKTPSERLDAKRLPPLSVASGPSMKSQRAPPPTSGHADAPPSAEVSSAMRVLKHAGTESGGSSADPLSDDAARPRKAARTLSHSRASPAGSTPVSMATSADTAVSVSATSVSPIDSTGPRSPLSALPVASQEIGGRSNKYLFSSWPPADHHGSRPSWQPAFSSARFATASKLSNQHAERKGNDSKEVASTNASNYRPFRSTASLDCDTLGAAAY